MSTPPKLPSSHPPSQKPGAPQPAAADTAGQVAGTDRLKEENLRYARLWNRVLREASQWDYQALRQECWSRRSGVAKAVILVVVLSVVLALIIGACIAQYKYLHWVY
ncbi:hypothetical protein [Oecophyllibacter saccharovorans]|uniref:hypothetical protein n=1 Tax=Oecophyllibacter saccharovorans TaxID=2558360 RepID=UPI00116D3CD4|nr:hypothetical protein [Oecophyllibacter saccharovorans]TPW35235.1 hypothetical protein E3203_07200 [Oecophyllibacter saccharovorans]